MATSSSYLICAACGLRSPLGTRHCPRCGEAVDPQLVEELRWLYGALSDLEARIRKGQGERSIVALHDEYRERYLALRRVPATPPRHATAPTPLAAAPAAGVGAPSVAAPVGVARPVFAPPITPPREAQVFSWRAFLADQAIAIMAYLGGFLLLVATLTFEVGAWQISTDHTFNDRLKLGIVSLVYILFGGLGFALRRISHLHTVGGAYLGVFALMTPLVALAAYLYALRGLGVPVMGMLSISAFYAAIVYLALAWRTGFATYAYLGWSSFLVGALAIVQWADAPREWSFFALAAVSLALFVPRLLRGVVGASVAVVEGPALHLGTLTSIIAGLTTFGLGLTIWSGLLLPSGGTTYAKGALAFAACAVALLAAGWSVVLRTLKRRSEATTLDSFDVFVSVAAIYAVLTLAIWAGAGVPILATLLAALALVEFAAALVLARMRPSRGLLRVGLERVAFGIAALGVVTVLFDDSPNWPLLACLGSAIILAMGIAVRERTPWWLLASGPFLLVGCTRVADIVRMGPLFNVLDTLRPELTLNASFYALLALALVALGLALGARPEMRPSAIPLHVIATAAALIATTLLPVGVHFGALLVTPHADYQTTILALFIILALVVGRSTHAPIPAGFAVGFFGLLLPLPYTLNSAEGLPGAGLALGAAVLAIVLRRALDQRLAWAVYGVALWVTLLAVRHTITPGVDTASWSFLGISFGAWLLLVIAAFALVAALLEGTPWATVAPALLAGGAVLLTGDAVARLALVGVFFGVGAALRQLRGRYWSIAWHSIAVFSSLGAVAGVRAIGDSGPYWQIAALLTLAMVAYLIAAQERTPGVTALATFYGLWAGIALPETSSFASTLALTFAAAGLGAVVRLRFGRFWALALYGIAVGASVLAIFRVTPFEQRRVVGLLLLFMTLACVLAALERTPIAGIVPALYAVAAVFVEPDTHVLVALALAFALVALALGRTVGSRWSVPWYAVATVAGVATGLRGVPDAGFEAGALLVFALAVYLIAIIESLPETLPLALTIGALALGAFANYLRLEPYQTILAFVGLSYVYAAGQWAWLAIPWLRARERRPLFSAIPDFDGERLDRFLADPHVSGATLHRWSSLLLAIGTVFVAVFALNSWTPLAADTQVVAISMIATAGLIGLQAWLAGRRVLWYLAGELGALAITWEARWIGADNLQAFVLAPGSYQLLIGALLPGDKRVVYADALGRWASLTGALLLLVPTLYQALSSGQELLYGTIMAVEALIVIGLGVGLRARLLLVVGAGFLGFATIRGAMLAVSEGVPIAVIFGAFALLLLGGALWLSLRQRRDQGGSGAATPTPREPGATA